jgi:hypothetical protein
VIEELMRALEPSKKHSKAKAVVAWGIDGVSAFLFVSEWLRDCEVVNGLVPTDFWDMTGMKFGVYVWEGNFGWQAGGYEYPHDGEWDPVGEFRDPTEEEWWAIRRNESPWKDEEQERDNETK